jgi:transcriptional regulator with XRE-family HTH domain
MDELYSPVIFFASPRVASADDQFKNPENRMIVKSPELTGELFPKYTDIVAETLSERLKLTLQKLGVNQQEFSEKIGFAQSYISKILSGAKVPSSRFFDIISHELYINPAWLRYGSGEMFLAAESGLSPQDAAMVAKYRLLTPEEKYVIDKMTDALLKKKEEKR